MSKRKCENRESEKMFKSKKYKEEGYVKPSITDQTSVPASVLWKYLQLLCKGKLVQKPINKWTVREKEQFAIEMNKYLSVSFFDDADDQGTLSALLTGVDSYLLAGNDAELLKWLDPTYLTLDWTQTGLPLSFPTHEAFGLPVNVPLAAIAGLNHTYGVNNVSDGEFVMGMLKVLYPGISGFVFDKSTIIMVR